MKKPKVGVIGLGNMGRGIARCYVRSKIPIAVWDVADNAVKPFRRYKDVVVSEPGEMAGMCPLILFVVPGSSEIQAAMKGKKGVLANARDGLVIYDLTTSDPAVTKKIARSAARKAVSYLDAGMSGGASGADAGTLTLMIGGDEQAFKRTRKFLKPFTEKNFYLGKSGTGHTLKLIHNMVCHTNFIAACEGGRMAERAGIRLKDMVDVFNVANARSYISQVRFPKHILSKKWDAKSRIYNLHKDLGMAVSLARDLDAQVTLGEGTLAFLEKAVALGMVEEDFSLLYRDFEKIRGKQPKKK